MHSKYSKQNLLALLMLINLERHDGIFMHGLMQSMDEERSRLGPQGGRPFKSPSRSTWYNYFGQLDEADLKDANRDDVMSCAAKFWEAHKKKTDNFARMFGPREYAVMRNFMLDRGYLVGEAKENEDIKGPPSLFYAVAEHLSPDVRELEEHNELVGTYQVFRPSLSSPGRFIVSAARIAFHVEKGIVYREIMHFRNEFGWRRQRFDGTAVSQGGHVYLLTSDDNTRHLQMSVLRPMHTELRKDGQKSIRTMAGTYNGASSTRRRGFFSTGIFLARINLDKLSDYDVHQWRIGQLSGFGLVDKSKLPSAITKFLHE